MYQIEQLQCSNKINWKPEYRPCPICGKKEHTCIGKRGGDAHRDGVGINSNIVKCLNCTTLYVYPALIPQSNPYEKEASEYFDRHDMESKTRGGEEIAQRAESILGAKGKMLEVGCGRGETLLGAKRQGWDVYGIEMTPEFAYTAESQGIGIEISSVEKSELLDKQLYAVIVLSAVLEHFYEPAEVLRRVYKALRPGGLVFIDVPNELSLSMRVGNFYMRMTGKDWAINMSPTFSPFHVIGFSPTSLKYALKDAGFKIHSLSIPKYRTLIPKGNTLKRKIERAAMSIVQNVGSSIGQGDGILCWAIKE